MELLHVLEIVRVAIFLQLPEAIVNGRRCGGKNSIPVSDPAGLAKEYQK